MKDDLISKRSAAERLIIAEKLIDSVLQDIPTDDLMTELYVDGFNDGYKAGKRDAEPKKGTWIPIKNTRLVECECGFITDRLCEYNFCPNCGARMEESDG